MAVKFSRTQPPEGELLLDVSEEAGWVRPVIAAVAGTDTPPGAFWHLPGESLTEAAVWLEQLDHDFANCVATRLPYQKALLSA